jgi:uncharacterized protein YigA (DUF484 family)
MAGVHRLLVQRKAVRNLNKADQQVAISRTFQQLWQRALISKPAEIYLIPDRWVIAIHFFRNSWMNRC